MAWFGLSWAICKFAQSIWFDNIFTFTFLNDSLSLIVGELQRWDKAWLSLTGVEQFVKFLNQCGFTIQVAELLRWDMAWLGLSWAICKIV